MSTAPLTRQNYGHGVALYHNQGPNGYLVKLDEAGHWKPVDHADHDLNYDTLRHEYGLWSPGKTLGLFKRDQEVSPKDVRPFNDMVVRNYSTSGGGGECGGFWRYTTVYTLNDAGISVQRDSDGSPMATLATAWDQQNFKRYVSGGA